MMCPELICRIACGCDGRSVYMDRITHTSSIHEPTCGNRSLTSIPLCPYFLKVNGEASSFFGSPFFLSLPGMSWPLYFASDGFGSKVSTCEGPPFRKRKMTCLAVAGKCVERAASAPAASLFWASRLASPSMPKPFPAVRKSSRRVIPPSSIHKEKLVGAQKRARKLYPAGLPLFHKVKPQLHLSGQGIAGEHAPIRIADLRCVVPTSGGDPARQGPGAVPHEIAIHKIKLLRRRDGRHALLGGRIGIRKIE